MFWLTAVTVKCIFLDMTPCSFEAGSGKTFLRNIAPLYEDDVSGRRRSYHLAFLL